MSTSISSNGHLDLSRRRLLQAAGVSIAALALGVPRKLPAAVATTGSSAATIRSRLILLGTAGGPTPKVDRSAPANAIVVGGDIYVIDCGNGVARQMVKASLDLGRIRDVFITHQHSDHNADYGNLLLLAWATDLHTPVNTYGPPPLERMTELFLEMDAYDIGIREKDEGRPPLAPLIRPHEITRGGPVMHDANVKVSAALVQHPPVAPAFAYRFDCPDRSIVFSGDTGPSGNLIALAHGADILVHEVIDLKAIDKVVKDEAMATRLRAHLEAAHTPMSEVGRIATKAGVKTLVLNHFVPGTPPIPDQAWYDAVKPHFKGRVIVGHDLMEL
ncbi:MAG: MBL fold metallo-hydrolase [Xanthomonadales bacterium]|mgnify:FL=1|nr:MBL fold metallo-hydrolase [Xanthomonadales bacterium]ODU93384.1 MAG: MBL fold metallo-hydrolase [Rhodanobacter sp. SCN 66-43]OJY83142.1 MAG: MBL fold metallo-hydrolase [Xanthomonadales bacterium 66-474]